MSYNEVLFLKKGKTESIALHIEDKKAHIRSVDTALADRYILFPAMTDLNCSTQNESFSQKALQKLSQDAYHSGVGHLLLRPVGSFPIDNSTALSSLKAYVSSCQGAHIHAAILAINDASKLSNIAMLSDESKAFFIYSDSDHNLIVRVMQYAKLKQKPIVCFLRDRALNGDAVIHEGHVSSALGLLGDNPLGERVQVDTIIEMADTFGVEVLIQGISTAKVLEKIAQAKERGVRVKSELSIHHLLNNEGACEGYNSDAKITPPLRDEAERLALIEALKAGKVDMLTALHHPKSSLEKGRAFSEAASGTIGFSELFGLYYEHLVKSGLISLEKLYELTVNNPNSFLKLEEPECYMLYEKRETTLKKEGSLYDGTPLSVSLIEQGIGL